MHNKKNFHFSEFDHIYKNNHSLMVMHQNTEKQKKVKYNLIKFKEVPIEEMEKVYCKCNFCQTEVFICRTSLEFSLSGYNKFFCNFCIRNNFHHNNNKHILVMTYRALIAYYYYGWYKETKQSILYLSEIKDMIDTHEIIGLQNPFFVYNPNNFLWFIDFNRIGGNRNKLNIDGMIKTTMDILKAFNLNQIENFQMDKLQKKYKEAIDQFYMYRRRPNSQWILCPTLIKTGASESVYSSRGEYSSTYGRKFTYEELRNFTPSMMVTK